MENNPLDATPGSSEVNWEGRSDRYFDPHDERFMGKVERDPDQLKDDMEEREMKDTWPVGNEIFESLRMANDIALQGMKSGVEIGRQESAARIASAEKAMRACHAWHIAEQANIGSFDAKMELCNYSQYLVAQWLGVDDSTYSGVPRLKLFPVHIDRATEENAEQLVAEVFAHIGATAKATKEKAA